jgi:hypothetical protein
MLAFLDNSVTVSFRRSTLGWSEISTIPTITRSGVSEHALGLQMFYPHPQLRPKPLSRILPQPAHGGLATARAAIRSRQAALSACGGLK